MDLTIKKARKRKILATKVVGAGLIAYTFNGVEIHFTIILKQKNILSDLNSEH